MKVLLLALASVLIGAWVMTRPTDPSVRGVPAGHGSPEVSSSTSGPAPRATPSRAARKRVVHTEPPSRLDLLDWHALRMCESTNRYDALNPSGKYRGAYQADQPTWDSVMRRHWPSWVGHDPAQAPPQVQDFFARRLYEDRGASPWPVCGKRLER